MTITLTCVKLKGHHWVSFFYDGILYMKLELLESLKTLTREDNEQSGRMYIKENKKYYSVTTFLSKTKDKTQLDAWRKRVGIEKANAITKAATTAGSSLHNLLENKLLNKEVTYSSEEEELRFNILWDYVNKEINTVKGIEFPLYSDALKLAGTCDLLFIDQKGTLVLADLKTAKQRKNPKWLLDYYHQITCYSLMLYECYGLVPEEGRIMISIPGEPSIQEISFTPQTYMDSLSTRLKRFHHDFI